MRDFYDSQPQIGALAPKLLYEDDSIQHAGMHFHQPPGQSVWEDSQYYKGLHRTFHEANVTRTVPAVTGACMMIERALFEDFGGLSGNYVRGDYEDFDLCLRLIESGRQNWYLPVAELYHLEAQSYTPDLRRPANRYNVWLHTHLWKDRIGELLASDELNGGPRGNDKVGDAK
jgi:GT2 family glycosyltransferase